jgi:serine phosphatase RsbU (regulator of sigma subunit)
VGVDGERFGSERLLAALSQPAGSAQELVDGIEAALAAFADGMAQRDDVACLVLRRR